MIGTALAAGLAWPASVAFQIHPARFTGERAGMFSRAARATLLVAARAGALVLRAIPEVAWLLILAALFKVGPLPGVLALSIHSAGVLGRVYVESIDNLSYRSLEPAALGGRAGAFLYAITAGLGAEAAGKLASRAAAEVVSDYGPRLAAEKHAVLKKEVLG